MALNLPAVRPFRRFGARPLRRASSHVGPRAIASALLCLLAVVVATLGPAPGARAQTADVLGQALEAAAGGGGRSEERAEPPGRGPASSGGSGAQQATAAEIEAEASVAEEVATTSRPLSLEADAQEIDLRLRSWDEAGRQAEDVIARGVASGPAYEALRSELAGHRDAAAELARRALDALTPLRAQLDALTAPAAEEGEPQIMVSPGVARQRRGLQERIARLEEVHRRSEQALTRATSLIAEIDGLMRRRFLEQLATLGPTPLNPLTWRAAATEAVGVARRVVEQTSVAMDDAATLRDWLDGMPLTLGLIVCGLGLMFWLLRRLEEVLRARLERGVTRSSRAAYGAIATLVGLALPVTAALLLRLGLGDGTLIGPTGRTLLNYALAGVMVMGTARGLAIAFYAPRDPALRMSSLDDAAAANAARRAQGLGLALLLDLMLVRAGEEVGLSAEALAAFNLLVIALGATCLWLLARSVGPRPAPPPDPEAFDPLEEPHETVESLGRRIAWLGAFCLRLAAAGSLALALAGYYAAAQFLFRPLALSLGLICACVLLYSLLRNFVEAYMERPPAEASGLRLLPVVAGFLITLGALPLLAFLWGARKADLFEVWRFVIEGAEVGGVHVSPAGFISFTVVFGVVFGATRLAQMVMATSVLPNTRLDAGGRSAVTASMGYLGFLLAAVTGIAAAGIDLSSLAIVFGALSVGIGFGLQTIFSNFVSGVILMLERPIKVGDWIFVGGDHGIVKRISVRATEIETFDKSSLILPNSQLIEGKVVNYTHSNSAGRLIVKVMVAHGTDLRAAHSILMEIARADHRVLRYPAPQALVSSFGESGVNLELRVILRDVLMIFDVQTDVYLEVYERFREAGIVIPLPQRVMRLAEPERLAEALRAMQEAGDGDPLDWPEAPPEGEDDGAEGTGGEDGADAPARPAVAATRPILKGRRRKQGPVSASPAANEAPSGGVPSADQAGRVMPGGDGGGDGGGDY